MLHNAAISYGHALEAAAAAFGYANWPTLQAALNSQEASEHRGAPVVGRFPECAIPSFRGYRRSIAVVGDVQRRRQALTVLVRQAIAGYSEQKEDVAYYLVDAPEGISEPLKIEDLPSGGKQFHIEVGKPGSQFNLFDLAAGDRDLKVGFARDQKNSLLRLLFSGAPNEANVMVLCGVMEDLYERFSNRQHPQTKVRKYVPGINTEIDACLAGQAPFAWWDVADVLRNSGQVDLARRAELLATPSFEDFVELAEELTPATTRTAYKRYTQAELEVACEFIRARALELLKLYPFLNCITSIDLRKAAGLTCLVPSAASADARAVMYALSVHMCKDHHLQRLLLSVETEMEGGARALTAMNNAVTLPKALMVLGGYEAACYGGIDWQEEMVALVQATVMPLYKNVAESHVFFVEGGQSGTPLFSRYPRSKQNIVYVGTGGDQKKAVDLSVVKDLNLGEKSLDLLYTTLPTEQTGLIGALLVRDEHGAQHEDYVELPRL